MAKGQVVEMVVEEVAENLEEAAAVARKLDTRIIAVGLIGVGIGFTVGFIAGRRWQRQNAEDKAWKKAEEEIKEIREMYQRNSESVRIVQSKPGLNEVVEERGYSIRVEDEEVERPTKPPVPVSEPPNVHFLPNGEAKRHEDTEKDKYDGWNWQQEMLDRKNTERPYIIHQDEFFNKESDYIQATYTYYGVDEVLVNEAEEKIDDPNKLVGAANLERFGHGTDDWDVLYVRNDDARLDFEICRLNKSYEEEVLGITHDIANETNDETD